MFEADDPGGFDTLCDGEEPDGFTTGWLDDDGDGFDAGVDGDEPTAFNAGLVGDDSGGRGGFDGILCVPDDPTRGGAGRG